LVININTGPTIGFQQPVVQQPYGFQNGYPAQDGYQKAQPQSQPQGQGYPNLPPVTNSGSQDYQRVQN